MLRLTSISFLGCLATLGIVAPSMSRQPSAFPAPKTLGPVETYGANIQRSMSLMATSTGIKRNTVRILFYGQSITAQEWSNTLAERLKRRYPLADFVIENRAIGSFESSRLARTAEADLYPFYPDLVIFQNYGDPARYEDMIRRIRERTTADILMANDHVAPLIGEKMDEITDPKLLAPTDKFPWRNYVFLPAIAKQYRTDLADVRGLWKRYLTDHKLKPSDLLFDDLHLNALGNFLMGEIVGAHLRHRPELPDTGWNDLVKTYAVGPEGDVAWKNGKIVLPFEGNKIDLICKDARSAAPASIRIDGKKPSEFPELSVPTRTELVKPMSPFPPMLSVGANQPRVLEEWTLTATSVDANLKHFKFKVRGSITGEDGDGESGQRFVSKSGRVVFEPEDDFLASALGLSRNPNATSLETRWKVEPYFADEFILPVKRNPFGDTVVIAAQGLSNGKHTLEITGGPDTPLAAIRVHRPPLGRQ